MLYRLARPFLFAADPERAHDLGLAVAAYIARHRDLAQFIHDTLNPPETPVKIGPLTFPNPIGLAAGLDKNARAPLAWWAFGFGHVELGTVTPRPQPGNPKPRLFRLPEHRALVNRMGFNNDGAELVAKRLADQSEHNLRPPIPLGISLGKNKDTPAECAPADYALAAHLLAPHADYLAVNVSSPNTPGLRSLQSATELSRILTAIQSVAKEQPLFVKLAPELAGTDLRATLDTCATHHLTGVIATNTLSTAPHPHLPQGGLSGAPLKDISLKQVETIRHHLDPALALIACGGIDDAPSARNMLSAGATLFQFYTALIYEGPTLPTRILRGLLDRP